MTLKSISLLLIGAVSMIPTLALSQQRPEGFSLGLATVANDSPFVGGDLSVSLLPILGYDSQAFSVGVLQGLRVTAFDRDNFRLSLIAAPRFFLEIADTDGDALDGIERDITGEAGVSVEYTLGRATEVSLRAVQEFTDEHGGQELVLDVRQRVALGSFPLVIGGGLRWQSGDHAEYAWGVKPEEATSTRPAYAPGDVLIPSISIGTFVPVSEKVRVIATLRMDFLPEEVYNSPIIDQENTVSAFVGVTRTF
jgi:outer membrane protein